MIEKTEIERKSEELGVHKANVQRDYVFGWLLSGLFQPDNPFHNLLILKGGNCFRKAYFDHARFSNDLDFSSQTKLDEESLREAIRQACVYAELHSGVEFRPDENRIDRRNLVDKDLTAYEARVYFKSFYDEGDFTIKVDLDITEFDRIFLPIQTRQLIHSYSDADICRAELRCFKLEELLAAKLKALLQRRHSPDLYDFVHSIFFQKVLNVRRLEVITTFLKKTIYEQDPHVARGLLLDLPFQLIQGFWNEYLVCPKLSLISFEDAESQFKAAIAELFDVLAPPTPHYPGFAGVGRTSLSYFSSSVREKIMEAGRLQRILRIVYEGYERRVEPYSLVYKRPQGQDAKEYFYVWDQSGGRSGKKGIKSFLREKLQSIELTEETFAPRYPVEFTKTGVGYFSKPFPASPRAASTIFRSAKPQFSFKKPRTKGYSFGMTYTIECPYCGKKFKRSKFDTRLNEHKDRIGNRCFGRVGFLV